MVMGAAAVGKVEALKGRKDGPSRAMPKLIWLSVLHVEDLWASSHNILVIPKSGDNIAKLGYGRVDKVSYWVDLSLGQGVFPK
jgi:hypothetical protein